VTSTPPGPPGASARVSRRREPIGYPWFWAGAVLLVSAGSPWYLPPGSFEPVVLGLPCWLWISVALSLVFCLYVRWACGRLWSLVGEDENQDEVRASAEDGTRP